MGFLIWWPNITHSFSLMKLTTKICCFFISELDSTTHVYYIIHTAIISTVAHQRYVYTACTQQFINPFSLKYLMNGLMCCRFTFGWYSSWLLTSFFLDFGSFSPFNIIFDLMVFFVFCFSCVWTICVCFNFFFAISHFVVHVSFNLNLNNGCGLFFVFGSLFTHSNECDM